MSSAAKVGIVMLIALAVLGYFVLKIEDLSLSRSRGTRTVEAVFDDVAGLDDESAVRIAGVRKGHVTDIKVLPEGRAKVTMKVDDDVPLHADAVARVANLGLLGEKYIELEPGSAKAPVLTEKLVTVRGAAPATFDEITDQVSSIAEDVKAITTSLRAVVAGPDGQQRMIDIVDNVQLITEDVRALIAANRSNVEATLANTREITAHLRREIPRLADSIESVANQLGGTADENRAEVREIVTNLKGLSTDLRVTAENLNELTGQVRIGEGTVGKLFSSDEAHEKLTSALSAVESGVTELKNTLGRAARMQLELGIKADYLAGLAEPEAIEGVTPDFGGNSRSAVGLRLTPNPDRNRFYNIELSDDPRGKRRDKVIVETKTNPDTGESTTTVTNQTRFDRDFLISAQAGWKLDDFNVRIGLFESSGGAGIDYRFTDRIMFTGEAFDFGQRRDDNPHLRLFGEYTLRQEKENTPRIFFTTGIDNALNDTAFILGGGVRWTDEDLKYLLGSIPLGR
ncbi:MAG TPA: MlaD family protein [Thermoanaerobaculia bacterium]|nr:MlaD family protein [Thermoanaerobaculia bacterium]